MTTTKEQFVTDAAGKRVGVLLDLSDYERILAELEELASIRAYDAAKASPSPMVPFRQAILEIERERGQ